MTKEPSMKRRSNRHEGMPFEDNTSAHRVGSMSSHVPVWLGSRISRLTFAHVSRGTDSAVDADMNAP
jgi:hypothetical protein